ncbi:uncharacterized protein LOC132928862 [Rhopalosiphum padi]|uniref:uncharacterized protein LOC132928862 n=1 Tax=Rhopalosiphum padi TaxID=40932 RepID=UPI00298D61F3|nr:uncharacterized protein LOC132928862 [Rhopalosiphum padi]XP_060849774.1 uncharacterized protein LOC132928862 [Rhopalosiphum padi]
MCLIRDHDDNCERFVYPFNILDTIDLTLDEMGDDDDFIEITQRGDLWNYPYNLLPSSDEEETARGFIDHIMEDNNEDIIYASSVFNDSSNEINQNASTPSASVNINILETNDTDHSSEEREFELNIPQILLSMSRISNNLYNLTSASHD